MWVGPAQNCSPAHGRAARPLGTKPHVVKCLLSKGSETQARYTDSDVERATLQLIKPLTRPCGRELRGSTQLVWLRETSQPSQALPPSLTGTKAFQELWTSCYLPQRSNSSRIHVQVRR